MAAGFLDSNGVWQYGEDDERDTFSELLNIAMEAISDSIGLDRARLTALESSNTATSPTSGVATAAAGWTLGSNTGTKKNGQAWIEVTVTRTGGTITVPSDGDITNSLIATPSAGWAPRAGHKFIAAGIGRMAGFIVESGGFYLSSVPVGATIVNGAVFVMTANYPL